MSGEQPSNGATADLAPSGVRWTRMMPEGSTNEQLPPAGWYTDPATPTLARWWDGTQWTAHATPNPALDTKARSGLRDAGKALTVVLVVLLVGVGLFALAVVVMYVYALSSWGNNK